jgi:hypothetical protein
MDVVAGRKYTMRSGEEKTHWINCGEAAEWDDGGISLRIHAMPVGNWFDGTLKLFPRKDRDAQPARAPAKPHADASNSDVPFEDDIPFAPLGKRRHW